MKSKKFWAAVLVGVLVGFLAGLASPVSASAGQGSAPVTCLYERWNLGPEMCGDITWEVSIHEECLQADPDFLKYDKVCQKDLGIGAYAPKSKATKAKKHVVKPKAVHHVRTQPQVNPAPKVHKETKSLRDLRPKRQAKPANQAPITGAYLTYKVAVGKWLLSH